MYYLGIDLGGTNIAAGIVDESYHIIAKKSVPTCAERRVEAIIARHECALPEPAGRAGA